MLAQHYAAGYQANGQTPYPAPARPPAVGYADGPVQHGSAPQGLPRNTDPNTPVHGYRPPPPQPENGYLPQNAPVNGHPAQEHDRPAPPTPPAPGGGYPGRGRDSTSTDSGATAAPAGRTGLAKFLFGPGKDADGNGKPGKPGRGGVRRINPATSRVRMAHAVLWVLVGAGALSGPLALVSSSGSAAAPAPAQQAANSDAGPAGFAELFVATYLQAGEGTENTLKPFMATLPDLRETRPGRLYAARTTVIQAVEVQAGYWSVTVVAEVTTVEKAGYRPLGLRYYRVSVQTVNEQRTGTGPADDKGLTGQAYVATELPALVAPPAQAPAGQVGGGTPLPEGSPAMDTVRTFLTAYLTGQGELSRYTAPDVTMWPVTPIPFNAITVDEVTTADDASTAEVEQPDQAPADGHRLRVIAKIKGAEPVGGLTRVTYGLQLAARGGRWEVTALDAAVPVRPASTNSGTGPDGSGQAPTPTVSVPAPTNGVPSARPDPSGASGPGANPPTPIPNGTVRPTA